MSKHSLNDRIRFWISVASCADIVDDPEGFRHPLFARAVDLGVSPGELCEFCRYVQKLRSKNVDKRGEDSGVGGGLNLQIIDTPQQNLVAHQKYPLSENIGLSSVNLPLTGVQS